LAAEGRVRFGFFPRFARATLSSRTTFIGRQPQYPSDVMDRKPRKWTPSER
jgi:hypothetical protein